MFAITRSTILLVRRAASPRFAGAAAATLSTGADAGGNSATAAASAVSPVTGLDSLAPPSSAPPQPPPPQPQVAPYVAAAVEAPPPPPPPVQLAGLRPDDVAAKRLREMLAAEGFSRSQAEAVLAQVSDAITESMNTLARTMVSRTELSRLRAQSQRQAAQLRTEHAARAAAQVARLRTADAAHARAAAARAARAADLSAARAALRADTDADRDRAAVDERRVAAAIERAEERVAAAAAAQGEERLARIGREARGAVRNAAAAVIAAYIAYKALFAGPTAQSH